MKKRVLCAGTGVFLLFAALYLNFFAPASIKIGVEFSQIDKILHFIGGIFLLSFLEWRTARLTFWRTFWFIIILFLLWKALELAIHPVAYNYIVKHLGAWLFDVAGDFSATVLGVLFYWQIAVYIT